MRAGLKLKHSVMKPFPLNGQVVAALGALLAAASVAMAADVTFQVNMSAQTTLGNFDPSTDIVFVAGDVLNAWSSSASQLNPSAGDANIWEGTFTVDGDVGTDVQYKFIESTFANGVVWEGDVGPGGAQNRTFTLADTNQALPSVYFNNITNVTSVVGHVTFQIDLSVQIQLGNFDPSSGSVSVAGDVINNWSTSASQLNQDPDSPNVWKGTFDIKGAPGSTVAYKYVLNGGTWEINGLGPNGGANRTFSLAPGNTVLPVAYFNGLSSLPTDVPVTFSVDLGVQMALGNFDGTGTVSVAGDLINNWSATASVLKRESGNSTVWSGTFDIQGLVGTSLLYKFVLNDGSTWESTPNRAYALVSTNAQAAPKSFFNNVATLGKLSLVKNGPTQYKILLPSKRNIRLQSAPLPSGPWTDVPGTAGQGYYLLTPGSGNGFFRLTGP